MKRRDFIAALAAAPAVPNAPLEQPRAPETTNRAACGNHRDNAIIAKRAGVKSLVLAHLLAQVDVPGIREQIVHEI